jgi:hypothetical protein
MNDDPPLEPEPPPPPPDPTPPDPLPPELSPLQTEPTAGTRFIESAGRGCLGTVSFIIAIMIFGTISAAKPIAGLTASLLAIAGMVVLRKRSGPSTILGAVAVGAAVALVLTGACAIVILNF